MIDFPQAVTSLFIRKQYSVSNVFDKISYKYTTALLVVSLAVISYREYGGE